MALSTPIYLDYAATTPVDPLVADAMAKCLTLDGNFGNPASRSYRFGWMAEEAVDVARNQISDALNCDPREIVFTSGATESNNLAIKGVAQGYGQGKENKGKHIITVNTEHKAVLDTCEFLEGQGFEVTYLNVQKDGLISVAELESALRDDTILVSVMHVNNELGVIQDIQAIGALCREKGILFHVDGAQSVGKIAIDLSALPIDLLSISAHKIYGPKGMGALYVRRRPKINLVAQIHGGGHERGMRSGTLATHQIVGMGEAIALANQNMAAEGERIKVLRESLWNGLKQLDDVFLNGHETQRVPGILNVSFAGVDGESLMMGLNDIAVSSGSACTSASLEPSYVLKAIGRSNELAHAGIRFSVGRFTTQQDIDYVVQKVTDVTTRLRQAVSA
ncbi:cysteine desulfurase [Alteromonas australica]|jgi:cysteine desulfurase|uniref:Cysteine desulfurase IscS n=1 Tax=Alteromonas australica TaxID=589873 RepID=A0A075NXX4_9ALTE|nr:IscS subfamily cysteine desulfurase [Alteromonas australica]MAB91923.1 IscS subfamily cysteine desulfurase [Alteromonas sp.]AIF99529.1 cysteine desulfurase [Alteromonas australica]AJP44533.1 cysteine desulfurase [Alteromonas australica]HAI72128.1 IscS subfamily cysteine desulfurase [Alteromonas australica]HBF71696.1 IscS subfamily cysteine desulfurase [Alteromonas australica]|tara:strand:- start:914 stop:2092 length:1179 start_codon:yes stop_codon:yes gene_type:complete